MKQRDNVFLVFAGTLLGVALGHYITRNIKDEHTNHVMLCAHIDTEDMSIDPEDEQWPVLGVETCSNAANTIIGGKSLCDDHFELYLDMMTQVTVRGND